MNPRRVLVIDDELAQPAQSAVFLRQYAVDGFEFDFARSLSEARRLQYWTYDIVLLDIRFEGEGDDHGIEILREMRREAAQVPVVMLSSRTTPDTLIRCWDEGAQGYVVKWTANRRFRSDLRNKLRRHARRGSGTLLLGESPAIREVRQTVFTLASYDISVLILGETGVGKELVARSLHEESKRADQPFIVVNCGAIPANLIESELFGHVRGAFTGAMNDRKGKIEEADGGTLFLDEVGDLPLDMQVKLLRFLDTGEFTRIGENRSRKAVVRVVAATNRDLKSMVANGAFREDLVFRLEGFKVEVPPLRRRTEDIPLLAQTFLERFKAGHLEKRLLEGFRPECMQAMQRYSWPGNVREMKNVVERAAILTTDTLIAPSALADGVLAGRSASIKGDPAMNGTASGLPGEADDWPQARLVDELRMAVEAKRHVQSYKGRQWKAEFMRLMYPQCKAANAKGFDDLVKRLTQGPWVTPNSVATRLQQGCWSTSNPNRIMTTLYLNQKKAPDLLRALQNAFSCGNDFLIKEAPANRIEVGAIGLIPWFSLRPGAFIEELCNLWKAGCRRFVLVSPSKGRKPWGEQDWVVPAHISIAFEEGIPVWDEPQLDLLTVAIAKTPKFDDPKAWTNFRIQHFVESGIIYNEFLSKFSHNSRKDLSNQFLAPARLLKLGKVDITKKCVRYWRMKLWGSKGSPFRHDTTHKVEDYGGNTGRELVAAAAKVTAKLKDLTAPEVADLENVMSQITRIRETAGLRTRVERKHIGRRRARTSGG